jgi:hypothetical protein
MPKLMSEKLDIPDVRAARLSCARFSDKSAPAAPQFASASAL